MQLTPKLQQLRRAFSVLARNGLLEFLSKLFKRGQEMLGLASEDHVRYIQHKAQADAEFDANRGIDTGGIQHLHHLTINSTNVHFGISHIASDPHVFRKAFASIDIATDGFTFVDLGSGKGRALILALPYPFLRIIGVEFAEELHRIALANVKRLIETDASAARIELIHGDASAFSLPEDPLVLFLFHPFDAPIMKIVASNTLASWRRNRRPVRVVYVNPRHLKQWIDVGWEVLAREDYHAVLMPSVAR